MNELKVSFIVPVYNCENYLKRCVNSIVKQSYQNIEIILVNDGSLDGSADLCNFFTKSYGNVKVIHTANRGTVSARREGLVHAQGDFVCFIDADDWIDEEYCYNLILPFFNDKTIELVSSGLKFEYAKYPSRNFVLIDGIQAGIYRNDCLKNSILPSFIHELKQNKPLVTTSICSKMIKKSVAINAMKYMKDNVSIGEDGAYVLAVLLNANSICILDKAYYHYEQHENSQNYRFTLDSYMQVYNLFLCMGSIANSFGQCDVLNEQIEHYVKGYLREIEKSVFGFRNGLNVYLPKLSSVPKKSRIVVHGAGDVGTQYIKFIKCTEQFDLAGWIDKNSIASFEKIDIPASIGEICKLNYDYILLASDSDKVLDSMQNDLDKYNVMDKKIIKEKPIVYRI